MSRAGRDPGAADGPSRVRSGLHAPDRLRFRPGSRGIPPSATLSGGDPLQDAIVPTSRNPTSLFGPAIADPAALCGRVLAAVALRFRVLSQRASRRSARIVSAFGLLAMAQASGASLARWHRIRGSSLSQICVSASRRVASFVIRQGVPWPRFPRGTIIEIFCSSMPHGPSIERARIDVSPLQRLQLPLCGDQVTRACPNRVPVLPQGIFRRGDKS